MLFLSSTKLWNSTIAVDPCYQCCCISAVLNVLTFCVEFSFGFGVIKIWDKGSMFRPPFVLRLRLAPRYQPPLWPCNAQIRVFATHKSLPSPRRISSPRDGYPTPTPRPPRGVREDVNELKRRFTLVPDRWRAYAELARVDKPIGTVLLYLPCGSPSFFPISSRSC